MYSNISNYFLKSLFLSASVPILGSKSSLDVVLPEPELRHEEENFNISIHENIFHDNREDETEMSTVDGAGGGVTNQNRGSIIIRNAFVEKTPSWTADGSALAENMLYEKPLNNISHEVLFPEDRELFEQAAFSHQYTAFDDIETEVGAGDNIADLEETGGDPGDRVLSAEDSLEIERVVREHDVVYFSVNFGEVLIKEMLMCSMFGVQVRQTVYSLVLCLQITCYRADKY